MKRRSFVACAGIGLAAAALPVLAQRGKVHRVGWLSWGRSMGGSPAYEAFRGRLAELGYAEGRNLVLVDRWSEQDADESDRLAVDLLKANPDVVVTLSAAVRSVQRAGGKVPVVFAFSGDPVVAGLVESYARPGGNYTGLSMLSLELVGKRMELLRELLPQIRRIAVVANPQHPGRQAEFDASQAAAKALGITIDYHEARTGAQLEAVLPAITKARSEAIVIFPDATMMAMSRRVADFSIKSRIPAISGWSHFAEQGNVMSYGPNFRDSFRRLAGYVDKVLRGAKPADLPVELPTSVELCLNPGAARAMGVPIPQGLLLRADRVIEA